jgi:ureidoglycolate lyase
VTPLPVEPLASDAFAPFGEVIETAAAKSVKVINQGRAQRFHDLARIDVGTGGGHAIASIFAATPWPQPLEIAMLEQHPLGSQAFVPMNLGGAASWLVVVALGTAAAPDPATLRAFVARADQGLNYAPGTWHHPLLVLAPARFLVVDREGPGTNLVEAPLVEPRLIETPIGVRKG